MKYFSQKTLLGFLLILGIVTATAVTLENGQEPATVQAETQQADENIEIDTLPPENVKETEADLLAEVTEIGDDLDSALVYWNLTEGNAEDSIDVDRAWGMAITDTPQQVETLGAGLDPETEYSTEAYAEPVKWNDETMLNNFNDRYAMVSQEHEDSIQNLRGLAPLTANLNEFSNDREQSLSTNMGEGLFLSPDGRHVFVSEIGLGSGVERYDLDEPWDLESHPDHGGDVSADQFLSHESVTGIFLSPDGQNLFVAATSGIDRYVLDEPWDLDSASSTPDQSLDTEFSVGVFLSPDGRYVFVSSGTGLVERYDLDEPWDLESGDDSNDQFLDADRGRSLFLSPDGRHVFVSGTIGDSGVERYDLDEPWDLESGDDSNDQSLDTDEGRGVFLSPDGRYVFVSSGDGLVERYGLE